MHHNRNKIDLINTYSWDYIVLTWVIDKVWWIPPVPQLPWQHCGAIRGGSIVTISWHTNTRGVRRVAVCFEEKHKNIHLKYMKSTKEIWNINLLFNSKVNPIFESISEDKKPQKDKLNHSASTKIAVFWVFSIIEQSPGRCDMILSLRDMKHQSLSEQWRWPLAPPPARACPQGPRRRWPPWSWTRS